MLTHSSILVSSYPLLTCFFFSEEKIDHIDKRLIRLNHLVETLLADKLTATKDKSCHHTPCVISPPKPSPSTSLGHSNVDGLSHKSPSGNNTLSQSSFTAHSAFAIDLAQTVVGSTQLKGSNREVETLLGMLSHIRTAFTDNHDPVSHLFPLIPGPVASGEYQMPPLNTVVQLLQKSQGK